MGGARPGDSRDDRERFLQELRRFRLPKPCCVVFDGPQPRSGGPGEVRMGSLRIIFGGSESADAVLRRRARPGDTVVTSDFALQGSCRAAGARVMRGPDFLRGLKPLAAHSGEKPASSTEAEMEEFLALFGEGDLDP